MKLWFIVVIPFCLLVGCGQSDTRSYQGYVEAENIYLATPYSGTLKNLQVHRGECVKKGQLLFKLDDNPQAFQLQQAQAAMAQHSRILDDAILPKRALEIDILNWQVTHVEAQIDLALLRLKRYEILVKKHALDADALDAAKEHVQELLALKGERQDSLALAKLGARQQHINALKEVVKEAVAKIQEIKWQLKQKSVYAPDDGMVFDTYFRVGEFVTVDRPVLSLLTPNNIRLEFFVPVERLSQLKIGQSITYTCDKCSKGNKAIIRYISPEAEYIPPLVYSRENNDKLVFRIKATVQNPALLKPGQPIVITSLSDV